MTQTYAKLRARNTFLDVVLLTFFLQKNGFQSTGWKAAATKQLGNVSVPVSVENLRVGKG